MAKVNCVEDKYLSKGGTCCDRCPAGAYVRADCDGRKATQCESCGRGFYTATKNYLNKCQKCTQCSPNNHQRTMIDCTAEEDTVCECVTGYYCSVAQCGHCQSVTRCPPGSGVKVHATRTNDTICAPCEEGTYSNTSDFISPCRTHTRCKDLGRVLNAPGTLTTDAVCGDFKSHCPVVLPACLWAGFVLTVLVVFGLVCWRSKRRSRRAVTASSKVPVHLVEVVPVMPVAPLELPLPATEVNGHCQESREEGTYKFPLFDPDDNTVSCSTEDSVDSSLPITPLKASVSFADSNHISGSAGYHTCNFLRTYSEPQEDEWCGT